MLANLLCSPRAHAQNNYRHNIDSLKTELSRQHPDTVRLQLLETLFLDIFCSDTTSSIGYIGEYIGIANKLNRTSSIVKAQMCLGGIYNECAKNYPLALYWYDTAAHLSRITGDKKQEALIISILASIYEKNLNHVKAIEYYHTSIELDPDPDKKKGIFGDIGTIYLNIGDYPNAVKYFEEAYNIQNRELLAGKNCTLNDTLNLMALLISLGDVDYSLSQFDKALKNYHIAEDYNQAVKDKFIDLLIYQGLGKCFQSKKDYALAIQNYDTALQISIVLKNDENQTDILNKIGNIYLITGKLDRAIAYARHSLDINANNENASSLPGTYLLLGKIATIQGNGEEAVTWFNKAISLFNKARKIDDESAAWYELSNAYEQMNNIRASFDAYKHYIQLRDSVFNLDKTRQITSTEMQAGFARKQDSASLVQAKKDAAIRFHMQRQQSLMYGGFAGLIMVLLVAFFIYRNYSLQKKANVIITHTNKALNTEKQVSETLLLNILPADVAEELKSNGKIKARLFDNVTVLMTDFVGFTLAGEQLSPEALVEELHTCFEAFDNIIGKYKIEKIKTVGDSYVAVSGLPNANPHHARDIAMAAIDIINYIEQRKLEKGKGAFSIRIGINSGKLIAGIVGVKKFAYDIWGDTVNTAARMEQNGEAGKINIAHATYALIKDEFSCTYRGEIDAKNKGKLKMYFVEGRKHS